MVTPNHRRIEWDENTCHEPFSWLLNGCVGWAGIYSPVAFWDRTWANRNGSGSGSPRGENDTHASRCRWGGRAPLFRLRIDGFTKLSLENVAVLAGGDKRWPVKFTVPPGAENDRNFEASVLPSSCLNVSSALSHERASFFFLAQNWMSACSAHEAQLRYLLRYCACTSPRSQKSTLLCNKNGDVKIKKNNLGTRRRVHAGYLSLLTQTFKCWEEWLCFSFVRVLSTSFRESLTVYQSLSDYKAQDVNNEAYEGIFQKD